jgi:predicted RNase H-like HicB family nuclease
VSDGKFVLNLQEAEEGGFVVTSPFDPGLITEAETVKEAFENARDAQSALAASRRSLMKKLQRVAVSCRVNPRTQAHAPVPRHATIKQGTVRGICRRRGRIRTDPTPNVTVPARSHVLGPAEVRVDGEPRPM